MSRNRKDKLMKSEIDFKEGECVIAHLKSYAQWPAVITKVFETKRTVNVRFFNDNTT